MALQIIEFDSMDLANEWMAENNHKFHVFKAYPVGTKLPCQYVLVYAPRLNKGTYV